MFMTGPELDWTLPEETVLDEGRVRWTRFGQGPDLVLMHGTPFSSAIWSTIAARLAASFTVHAYDMPGYGASSKPGRVSLDVQNRVLSKMFRLWRLDAPVVVAHDIGGTTALRGALLIGLRYSRLLLMDAVAMHPWGTDVLRDVQAGPEEYAAMPRDAHRHFLDGYIASAAHHPLSPVMARTLARPWTGDDGQAAFYRQMSQLDLRHTDLIEARLPELGIPTSVLWGAEDTWLAPSQADRLASILGAGGVAVDVTMAPDAGHLAMVDQPALVLDWILSRA